MKHAGRNRDIRLLNCPSGIRRYHWCEWILLATLLVFGCSKDKSGNPVGPGPTDTPSPFTCTSGIWYGGQCYSADQLTAWGMGNTQSSYIHNDRLYEWYIDQGTTGDCAGNNCGPSSVVMSARWADSLFTGTVEEARDLYYNEGGWWYTNNIDDYLTTFGITHHISTFENTGQLTDQIGKGNLILLCIEMKHIRRNMNAEQRVDRFYSYGSGHFLLVKGVRKVDDTTFFEVYDSNNWYQSYTDGSEKGENRHYRAEDLADAIDNWWGFFFIIQPGPAAAGKTVIPADAVSADAIPHAWGR